MDVNVKVLMDATNCSEMEAQAALDSSGQDIRKAMEMLERKTEKQLASFNASFQSKSATKGQGFAAVVVDEDLQDLVHCDIVYPLTEQQALELDVHMPPSIYLTSIKRTQSGLGERLKDNCVNHAANFKMALGTSALSGLIAGKQSSRVDMVGETLRAAVEKALGESVELKCNVSSHPASAVKDVLSNLPAPSRDGKSESKDSEKGGAEKPDAHPVTGEIPQIILVCEPEISPFLGRPAKEFHIGEEIVVKVKDMRESARYFAELLGGIVGEEVIPLIAPVIKTEKLSKDSHRLLVEFGPSIWGEIIVPSHVKLKTRSEELEIYRPFEEDYSIFSENKFYNQFMLSVCVIFFALVGLVVFFAYTS